MKNILFIVEGKNGEKQLFDVIQRLFLKKEKNDFYCVPYCTNIYTMYKEILEDPDLEIVELVREKALKEKNMELYQILSSKKFPEVYLVFDLDPQDRGFSVSKVEEMIQFFDDETNHGKIYINYPMFESFKHFKSIPDSDFNSYEFLVSRCHKNGYKRYIDKYSSVGDLSKLNREKYLIIMKQMMNKYEYLLNCDISTSKEEYNLNFSQEKLLKYMKSKLKKGKVSVINTFCLWPIEYFNSNFFKKTVGQIKYTL